VNATTDNIEQRAREFLPKPCAYARVCDGAHDIRIGSQQPPNRAGGYATPWAAMYDTPAVLAAIVAALRSVAQPSGHIGVETVEEEE